MFNIFKLNNNRQLAKKFIQESPFHQFLSDDLIDRIGQINKQFNNILLISPILELEIQNHFKQKYSNCKITSTNIFETKILQDNELEKYDLIIFPFGLHWLDDVQFFLKQVHNILEPNGFFIFNFSGGGTLNNLRITLIELETKFNSNHYPHISPFIQFQHMTPLLQHAGFNENIIDHENIELEYNSPLKLMKALKNCGESNALQNIEPSITKLMYEELKKEESLGFIDIVNLITCVSSPNKQSVKLFDKRFLD